MYQSKTVAKIKNKKETIRRILMEHPKTRDNDNLLILKVWAEQNTGLRYVTMTFIDFANEFIAGQYVDVETIRRTRQKLQQQDPETRGESYKLRHKEAELTRKEIGDA